MFQLIRLPIWTNLQDCIYHYSNDAFVGWESKILVIIYKIVKGLYTSWCCNYTILALSVSMAMEKVWVGHPIYLLLYLHLYSYLHTCTCTFKIIHLILNSHTCRIIGTHITYIYIYISFKQIHIYSNLIMKESHISANKKLKKLKFNNCNILNCFNTFSNKKKILP